MLDVFKEWISSILAIGILFTIIKIIIPNTNLKKYIYSLMGIITVIVIINPVISFFKSNDLNSIKSILLNATNSIDTQNINYTSMSNYEDVNKNNVKENFRENVESDIKEKLSESIGENVDVNIQITDTYNIQKVNVTIYKDTSFDIVSFISKEYDIDGSKITIQKGG